MPVYDCRKDNKELGSIRFPCKVRILNPVDGQRITNVFYASTAPAKLGRFVVDADGNPMVDARTRRKKIVKDMNGRPKVEIVWDRLEVWTSQPWVAVAIDTGEVIIKSEGCP